MASYNIAFAAPEAPKGYGPSASKPIDLVHLARQTMGDRTVELEVLKIFARQARQCLAELSVADENGKISTAHRLKGAAQAVGAFPLSKFAEEMEAGALDAAHMAKMTAAIAETENFINRLCR